jgi:hypothetical protein
MDDGTFQRWNYLDTSRRRYAETASRLAKDIFGEEHRQPAMDLVSAMAQAEDAKVAEPESDGKGD